MRSYKNHRRNCTVCGSNWRDVGPISWAGYCGDCGKRLYVENAEGIKFKRGLPYARQRIGIALAAIGDARIVNALIDAGVFAYDQPTEPEVTHDAA